MSKNGWTVSGIKKPLYNQYKGQKYKRSPVPTDDLFRSEDGN